MKLHFFRKFLVPSILNVIGLAVAFASSFVILTQVAYDYTFDKGIEDHDKIFRIEVTGALFDECSPIMSKPASDVIGHQPHVLSYSAAQWSWAEQSSIEIESHCGYERIQNISFICGFGDFLSTFSPRMISGKTADMAQPNHVLLPLSLANKIFGTADCVGRQFYREDHETDPEPKIVAGVFDDFPSNSSVPNAVMIDIPSNEMKGYESWGRFNNSLYIKVDNAAAVDEVINSAVREIIKACPEQESLWGKEGALSARPLTDVHFSDLSTDTSASMSRSTMWLLLSLAIAIIVVAAINFTNFSLAETPLRIASINTRKVLGDSVTHLRLGLIAECVATCVVAFIIGMVALACADSWLTDSLVKGDPMSNHLLMALWLVIAVVTGVVAGAYPSYYVTSFPPALVLKGSFGLSPRGKALRTVLLCLQFATAFALMVSIGIMRDQMDFISHSYRGYDKDVVITAELNRESQKRQAEVRSELMGIAGVEDKVLGDSVTHLRLGLIAECVATCVVAFIIGMVALACADSWLTDSLVKGDPMSNHLLMALWLVIAVVTGVVAGAYPSYYVTSFPPALVLKGSFGLSPRGKALRTVLLCLQFATAFALMVSIGIMRDQMDFISHSYRGYDKDVVITAELNRESQKRQAEVRSELMGIAGVEDVSFSQTPLGADGLQIWTLGEDEDAMRLNINLVDAHYLHTMGIKIAEGRDFNETDKTGFIMNETAKRKYPKLEVGKPVSEGKSVNVIGICKNFQFRSLHNDDADEAVGLYLYNPERLYYITMNLRVAKGADRVATIDAIRKKLDTFSPGYDFQVRYYDEFEQQIYENEVRFDNQVSVFSVIAIVLSIMGVLGLTLFECASRQKEIGIRRVLGCSSGHIVWMFCRHYAVMLVISFAVGAPVGYIIVRNWLMGFAVRTEVSASAFIWSAVIVTAITILTVAITSLRSTRINPKDLLRSA